MEICVATLLARGGCAGGAGRHTLAGRRGAGKRTWPNFGMVLYSEHTHACQKQAEGGQLSAGHMKCRSRHVHACVPGHAPGALGGTHSS
eukprot:366417-Chlamydomonas_euryale.AAC.7